MDQEIAEGRRPGHRLSLRCIERCVGVERAEHRGARKQRAIGEVGPMRNRALLSAIALMALMLVSLVARAQNTPPRAPAGPPPGTTSKVADLSGDWAPDPKRGSIGQSLSLSDNGGRQR